MMRILGVDPGTRIVGYGVVDVESTRIQYIECGVIKTLATAAMPDRLFVITETLSEVIREFAPQVLVVESAFHGVNASSALKLGLARGAIMVIACQHRLEVSEYTPAYVKKTVVGHGRATKTEVQARVRMLCRLRKLPTFDAADALALAICHGRFGKHPILDLKRRAGVK